MRDGNVDIVNVNLSQQMQSFAIATAIQFSIRIELIDKAFYLL